MSGLAQCLTLHLSCRHLFTSKKKSRTDLDGVLEEEAEAAPQHLHAVDPLVDQPPLLRGQFLFLLCY
jgi:hypothetical protein